MSLRVRGGGSAERLVNELPLRPEAAPIKARPASERAERFRGTLAALGREIDRGEKLVARAIAPGAGRLAAGELIALQAGIYRYSEAVDLAAKLVDRAGSAIRTTLQSGGQ